MKLSPGSIEELLAPAGPRVRSLANAARTLIGLLVPHATERLRPGWGLIGYSAPRYFAFIQPLPAAIRIGFEWGVRLEDPRGLLEGDGTQVRFVTVTGERGLRSRALTDLIRQAAALSAGAASRRR